MAKVGRPPMFNNPDHLQEIIDLYFTEETNPTISGLALYCGFCDRYSFYDYEKKPEFTHTIKEARARMVKWYEENVFENAAGAIFMLKNFGYSDRQDLNVTGNVSINPIQWADDE